jgi:LysR family transcriptional activator of glutamate synthase operon
MTLTQMRYFVEVCKWKNITKASISLHVSQPTVTISMKELEAETGLNLFIRNGRRIVVTQEGKFLLNKIGTILNSVEQLNNDILDLVNTKNHIKLAIPLQVGSYLIPMILAEFSDRHPEINLEIVELGGMDSLRMVENEEIDLAITIYEADFCGGLNYTKLFDSECCFCTNIEHPLATKKQIEMPDLSAEKFVVLQGGFFVNKMVYRAFENAGIKPKLILRSAQLHTIKSLVNKNIASTFLMRETVIDDPKIVAIPFANSLKIRAGIVTKQNRQIYSDVKKLIDFMKQKFR